MRRRRNGAPDGRRDVIPRRVASIRSSVSRARARAMDPPLSWIRVDDSAHLSMNARARPNFAVDQILPSTSSSSRAAMYGLCGSEAQCRAAFKALTPTPAPRARVHAPERRDTRAKAFRMAFDEDDTAIESSASYHRAEEALRYRALWLGNRAAWLIASKSRWRAMRAKRQNEREIGARISQSPVAQSGASSLASSSRDGPIDRSSARE